MTSAAFFDLDETLVDFKSMFVFLEAYLDKYSVGKVSSHAEAIRSIQTMVLYGAGRGEVNTYYYSLFAGEAVERVRATALDVFEPERVPFNRTLVGRVELHKTRGDLVVVVSGAMADIVFPMTEHLEIDHLLCSQPEVVDGLYTGRLAQRAIGQGKGELVATFCNVRAIDPSTCFAYGDHPSDKYMLGVVGHPTVVRPGKELRSLAESNQWAVID